MKKFFGLIFLTFFLIAGCSPMSTPNFQQLTLPSTPNYFLACPENYCNVTPSLISPVFPVPAEDLFNLFNQIIAQEKRVNFVYSIPEQGMFILVAHSLIFRFPDDIAVQFVALTNNTSSIIIYSKSRYGYYDFGVNKKRVTNWLTRLSQMTPSSTSVVQK